MPRDSIRSTSAWASSSDSSSSRVSSDSSERFTQPSSSPRLMSASICDSSMLNRYPSGRGGNGRERERRGGFRHHGGRPQRQVRHVCEERDPLGLGEQRRYQRPGSSVAGTTEMPN